MGFAKISLIDQDLLPQRFGGDHHFERVSSITGRHRHYRLRCSLTLWGEYAVERSWSGNTVRQPVTRTVYFQSEEAALGYLKRAVAVRLRRGYRPVGFESLVLPRAAIA